MSRTEQYRIVNFDIKSSICYAFFMYFGGKNFKFMAGLTAGACMLAFCVLFSSCGNEREAPVAGLTDADSAALIIEESEQKIDEPALKARHVPDNGTVWVVFGYGYNDDDFYEEFSARLESRYSFVRTLRFPEDFHNRISNLREYVTSPELKGIIIAGAPDGTHYAIASLLEQWDYRPTFNVFSFFPQDDILGQEGTCNFVLDHAVSSKISLEDEKQIMDRDIEKLICSAVEYCALAPSSFPADNDLHAHVQSVIGERKVRRYVDAETGIQSKNHFVIDQVE